MVRAGILALILVLLSSCSLAVPIRIFNNSGEMIILRPSRDPITINPGEAAKAYLEFGKGFVVVKAGEHEFGYLFDTFSISDRRYTSWLRSAVKIQLESDLRAFVLRDFDCAPIDVGGYPQPDGFPLSPIGAADSGM